MQRFFAVLVAAIMLISASAANAALMQANGAFSFNPRGSVIVDTGDINLSTSTVNQPDLWVNVVTGNLPAAISPGDTVTYSPADIPVPAGVGITVPLDLTLSVNDLVFHIYEGTTSFRLATGMSSIGAIVWTYGATLDDGGVHFYPGALARMSQSCDESARVSPVNCSGTLVTFTPVPEPTSLALLGAGLIGAGVYVPWHRRRRNAANDDGGAAAA